MKHKRDCLTAQRFFCAECHSVAIYSLTKTYHDGFTSTRMGFDLISLLMLNCWLRQLERYV